MPEITINDYSGGWTPGEDPIQGRKNGVLQMDNLELDSNGALSLAGGTIVKYSSFPSNAHTLYSRIVNGSRRDYSALVNGSIYRNSTSLAASGGDSTNAAFGTAFNYTLIASGNKRIKDDGTSVVNLGVTAPTIAPTILDGSYLLDWSAVTWGSLLANYVMYVGSASVITSTNYPSGGGHARPAAIQYLQVTADANGDAVVQTYAGGGPYDMTTMIGSTGVNGSATDDDIFPFFGYVEDPFGVSLQIDVLLQAGNSVGDQIENYFTFKIDDLSTLQFDSYTGVFYIYIKRSDFIRVGTGGQTWSTTYGYRITFKGTNGQVVNYLGNVIDPASSSVMQVFGGTNTLNGIYQFAQMNVNNTGSYVALSPLSSFSKAFEITSSQPVLDIETPTDAQVNEVWIFARSTGAINAAGAFSVLNNWYRIAKQTSSLGSNIRLTSGDFNALTLNIKFNQNLVTIASSGISDKIFDIIGPVNGRWYYFTTNFMYPSDINNPDLVDTSIAIRITGSSSETFLWARQLNDSTILVGTSVDVYSLSGTFATFPDFSIDAYYRPLHCKYPPLTSDAEVWGSLVFYLASDGWRSLSADGSNPSLVSPSLDRLYRGETIGSYVGPNLKIVSGSVRFPIVIAKNKMFCFITGLDSPRIEVYDFIRQYWRPVVYGLGEMSAATHTPDGQVLVFYNDKKLREIDVQSSRLLDAATKQTFTFKSMVKDGGFPRQRKDSSTLKIRLANSDLVAASLIVDGSATVNSIASAVANTVVKDQFFDLALIDNVALVKTYQVYLTGLVSSLILDDINITFDLRPEQRSFIRVLSTNFESGSKKRLRNWPIVIDTLGNTVTLIDSADNSIVVTTNLNTLAKSTVNIFFNTDVFGVDYSYTLHCATGLFEYFNRIQPEIVQVLPIAKQFDQLGPEEFFRYGKIKQIELRVLAYGTLIPYIIYFNDDTIYSGVFSTIYGKENSCFLMLPKGVSGNIIRIELGPTNFNFHRFYTRLQVAKSGSETDLQWINI